MLIFNLFFVSCATNRKKVGSTKDEVSSENCPEKNRQNEINPSPLEKKSKSDEDSSSVKTENAGNSVKKSDSVENKPVNERTYERKRQSFGQEVFNVVFIVTFAACSAYALINLWKWGVLK